MESGKDVSASVELFDRVNRQDFDACERCQPAMGSRVYAKGGVLVPSEHHIGAFHDWVHERLAGRRMRAGERRGGQPRKPIRWLISRGALDQDRQSSCRRSSVSR